MNLKVSYSLLVCRSTARCSNDDLMYLIDIFASVNLDCRLLLGKGSWISIQDLHTIRTRQLN